MYVLQIVMNPTMLTWVLKPGVGYKCTLKYVLCTYTMANLALVLQYVPRHSSIWLLPTVDFRFKCPISLVATLRPAQLQNKPH